MAAFHLIFPGSCRQKAGQTHRFSLTGRRASDLAGVREADQEAGTTSRLLEALEKIREEAGEVLTPTELLHALKARTGWDWLKSPRRLAGLLNPLGLFRQQCRERERRRWCYVLSAETLADLRGGTAPLPRPGLKPEPCSFPRFLPLNPVTR